MVSRRNGPLPYILFNLVPSYYNKQNAENQIRSSESLIVIYSAWIKPINLNTSNRMWHQYDALECVKVIKSHLEGLWD